MIQIRLNGDIEERLRAWSFSQTMKSGRRRTALERVERAILVLEAIENCTDKRLMAWVERGALPAADCENCGGELYDDEPICEVCGPPFDDSV